MFSMTTLAQGDLAPVFSLPDQDGSAVSLADFAGRRVVVYFYPADDTPGCTKEACQFSDLVDEYAALGVEVLGISPDGGTRHQRFRAKYGLKIALLSDPTHEVMARYGAFGEKTLYGRKTVGVIRSTFLVGADGRIERAWYHVRADGHAAKVLQALG
jgi:peroxiredoxin Q/BCP